MAHIILALGAEALSKQVRDTLDVNGLQVGYICRGGGEAIKAAKNLGRGVVICPFKLPDMTADFLSGCLRDTATVLVIAKPALLDLCSDADLFRLPAPFRAAELVGCVRMLTQMDDMRAAARKPRRSAEDEALISRAKGLLMERNSLTEHDAHRYLQQKSMSMGCRLTDTAMMIVNSLGA